MLGLDKILPPKETMSEWFELEHIPDPLQLIFLKAITKNIHLGIYDKLDAEDYLNKFNSNSKIEELLYNTYNIKMNIQEDYMIIKNDTVNSKFTWIGRGFPYRWLTFTVLDDFEVRDVWIQYEKLLNENYYKTKKNNT